MLHFLLTLAPLLVPQGDLQHREVRVLDLSGTPHERGLAHGRALKAEIHEMIGDFKQELETDYGVDASVFIERFLSTTDFIPAIEQWTPGLIDEVRGIAEGAELPFEEVYAWQLGDEIWSMGKWALREKCTAVAVGPRGDQPTIVAQTMDIPGFYQKHPLILRIRSEEGPDVMVFTCPGAVGVNGMNSEAVAIACNTLLQLRPSPTGVPCLFVVRGALERSNLAEAEAWLKLIPHAVGQNYTLGDPTGARAFECSAGAKLRYQPDPDGDFTYHTNHPLVNTDWHPDYVLRCKEQGVELTEGWYRRGRFEALQERFPNGAELTRASIYAALRSCDGKGKAICGDWNYGCTVFVLKAGAPLLELSPGRPDTFAVQTFKFSGA